MYTVLKPTAPHDALNFYLEYAKNANGPIFEPVVGELQFLRTIRTKKYFALILTFS